MPELTLHNYELDENCYRVRLMLGLLALPHRVVSVNAFPSREHLSPRYLALSPLGRLPILEDGDLILNGAEAILVHLAANHDPERRYLPENGAALAQTMQWLFFAASELGVAVDARNNAVLDTPGDATALRAGARHALRVMEDHILIQGARGETWFAGPAATVADVTLFPAFALSRDYNEDHDEYPGLRNWGRRVRALPGFVSMPGIPDYH